MKTVEEWFKDVCIYNIGDGIPTLPHNKPNMVHINNVHRSAIAFAKHHVKLALEAAAKHIGDEQVDRNQWAPKDKSYILNAYSLDNIK